MSWNPPKYMGACWEDVFVDESIQQAFTGWIGSSKTTSKIRLLSSFFLDRFEAAYERRLEFFAPGLGYDIAIASFMYWPMHIHYSHGQLRRGIGASQDATGRQRGTRYTNLLISADAGVSRSQSGFPISPASGVPSVPKESHR